jgi:glycosidase
VLADFTEENISGSGFAISAYEVDAALGGKTALADFRRRLAVRGIRLMLDFVPNHSALDHSWVRTHPGFYIEGSEQALAVAPQNYRRMETRGGSRTLAHGRDPNFPGWPDTLQLNYGNPALHAARMTELIAIAGQCDGVRCDMATRLEITVPLGSVRGEAAATSRDTNAMIVSVGPIQLTFIQR